MHTGKDRFEQARDDRSRHVSSVCVCVHLWLIPFLAGCETSPPTHSAAVRAVVTPPDPTLATVDYWWAQPPVAHADAPAFQPLWDACKAECYYRLFLVDREEYRRGLLTTLPTISKQAFEPWRTDAVTDHDVVESTLGTVRRTLRFEVARRPDGTFQVVPKVLVERYSSAERRLTSFSQYRQAFSGTRATADDPDLSGDVTTAAVAADYWYPLRRDAALEQDLAGRIAERLAAKPHG